MSYFALNITTSTWFLIKRLLDSFHGLKILSLRIFTMLVVILELDSTPSHFPYGSTNVKFQRENKILEF